MSSAVVTMRPMRAEDIDVAVTIHGASFPDSRSTRLGRPFLRKMYRWFVACQPDLAIVACLDGAVVGFVTGAIGGSSRKIFRYALPEVIWGFLRRPRLLLSAGMYELWPSYLLGLVPRRKPPRPAEGDPAI